MKDRATLPTISFELPGHLSDLLKKETNNIQHSEIDTPEKRELKLEEIKQKLLWQEVTISDFKVVKHRSETIQVPRSFENPFPIGQEEEVFIVTVEATTTGNSQLFDYQPQSFRFSSNMDNNVYQPVNNKITLEIQSKTLTKEIINETNKKMTFTKVLIENNNQFITEYKRSFVNTIEERFNEKADEIEQLYS